jgi:hypothetical protein
MCFTMSMCVSVRTCITVAGVTKGPLVNQLPVSGFFGFVAVKLHFVGSVEDHCLNTECLR